MGFNSTFKGLISTVGNSILLRQDERKIRFALVTSLKKANDNRNTEEGYTIGH